MKDLPRRTTTLRVLYVLPCFALFTALVVVGRQIFSSKEQHTDIPTARGFGSRNLHSMESDSNRCIPPSIDSFPGDFLAEETRLRGGIVIHFLIVTYLCAMLAIVCNKYFLPSLEMISERLKLPTDVAGATFMAIGTSSPELFSAIIGSFITEGDIGVGTIVGSAVFNILGVTGLAGLVLWRSDLDIDWYPISRDCLVYVVTVTVLILVISNNIVTWWKSLVMLLLYGVYIAIMYYNTTIEKFSHKQLKRVKEFWTLRRKRAATERSAPLVGEEDILELRKESPNDLDRGGNLNGDAGTAHDDKPPSEDTIDRVNDAEEGSDSSLCSPPKNGVVKFGCWLALWPASLLFHLTIPDPQNVRWRKWFPLSFLMSVLWLGLLSYVTVWMVTVIGFTLGIPDTVSGITILAAGSSVPEIISSVIVVKEKSLWPPTNVESLVYCNEQGGLHITIDLAHLRSLAAKDRGNMAICNLIGSNIFDILFCLGAPWLVKTLSAEGGFLKINSSALTYTTTTLLITVVIMYAVFHISNWKLNRGVGVACIIIYVIFLTLTCMYEMNYFGYINPPTCPS